MAPAVGALSEIVPPTVGVSYSAEEAGALGAALMRARGYPWSSQSVLAHARQFDWQIIGAQITNIYRTALLSAGTSVSFQEKQA